MNLLGSPAEVILSAAQTVLGRACCFFLACHVGVVMGALPYLASEGHVLDFLGLLVRPWLAFSVALASLFLGWGMLVYPLSLAIAIFFIRLELSFKWLLVPVLLIAGDTAMLGRNLASPAVSEPSLQP
ncbi:MAG TPA: hypothetical protein VGE29_15160 [Prosthecobacter sp.]